MPNEFIIKNGYFSQGNSTITGSLTVTAGITGSVLSSSYALNALTASYALTSGGGGGGGVSFVGGTNVDNRIITATGTTPELNGEANLSFNGSRLSVTGSVIANSFTGSLQGTASYAITASYAMNGGGGGTSTSTHYAAKLTQTAAAGGSINSGLLIVGESYEISTYSGGDDFSNVAEVTYGVINTTGCVFKATGTKPTNYGNGSTLTNLGYPIAEVTPNMNNLADGTIPYWRRLSAGTYHFNFTSSVDHVKIAPKFQPDSLNNYKTRAIVNQSDNSNYSFLDSRFATAANAAGGFGGTVRAIDYQSDGKIIVGGSFTSFNGSTVNYICRLNPDGTEDTTFTSNIGSGFNAQVFTIKVQSDNKILIGGRFTDFNGSTVNSICRLNSDGTLNGDFASNIGNGFNGDVYSIKLLSDNSIIIGGAVTDFDGNTIGNIAKLNSNGTYNSTFTTNAGTGFNSNVNSIDIDPSDNIYVGGEFTDFDGTTVNYAAKMSSTGVQDSTFSANMSTNLIDPAYAIRYNSNKVLIGGQFTAAFGSALNRICQINPDGTEDIDFTSVATNYGAGSGYNDRVFAIEAVADGWLVGGVFTDYSGTTVSYFNYLQNTGKQLNGYRAFGLSFDSTVRSLKLYPGNKVLVGGDFNNYDSVTNNRFANLYYTYDVVLIVDGENGVSDQYLNKSSIEVTLYN